MSGSNNFKLHVGSPLNEDDAKQKLSNRHKLNGKRNGKWYQLVRVGELRH